jgi:hypothetical protein
LGGGEKIWDQLLLLTAAQIFDFFSAKVAAEVAGVMHRRIWVLDKSMSEIFSENIIPLCAYARNIENRRRGAFVDSNRKCLELKS